MADRSYPIRANRIRDVQQATLAAADYNERQAVALERIADALDKLVEHYVWAATTPAEPPVPAEPPKEASDG